MLTRWFSTIWMRVNTKFRAGLPVQQFPDLSFADLWNNHFDLLIAFHNVKLLLRNSDPLAGRQLHFSKNLLSCISLSRSCLWPSSFTQRESCCLTRTIRLQFVAVTNFPLYPFRNILSPRNPYAGYTYNYPTKSRTYPFTQMSGFKRATLRESPA